MDNEINILKNQIKNNKLQKLYVFFGEEKFLQELYIKKITELVPDAGFPEFNRFIIDGAEAVRKSYPGFFEDYKKLGGICHVM